LAFGGEGLLRSNDPADPEKAIVYNELVANAVARQNVVDQTHALHALAAEGLVINHADLAFLSPYATRNLKRFGDYSTERAPEAIPMAMTLPRRRLSSLTLIVMAGLRANLPGWPSGSTPCIDFLVLTKG
jgi:hypothetical protein